MSNRKREQLTKLGLLSVMVLMLTYASACTISFVWYCWEFAQSGITWSQIPSLLAASFLYSFLFNQFWNIDLMALLPTSSFVAILYSKRVGRAKRYLMVVSLLTIALLIIYFTDVFSLRFLHDYQRQFYVLFVARLVIAVHFALISMEALNRS